MTTSPPPPTEIHAAQESQDFKGKDLSKENFKGANLENANLTKAILTDANLENANLKGARLNSANLEGANLNHATFADSDLSGAILINSKMYRVNFTNTLLISCNLEGANIINSKMVNANLTRAKMNKANLKETDFSDAVFSCADLKDIRIYKTNFSGADLTDAIITIDSNSTHDISSMIFKKYTEKYKKEKIRKRKKMFKNTVFYNYNLINEEIITRKYCGSKKHTNPRNSNPNSVHAIPTIPLEEHPLDDEPDARSCCWYPNINFGVFFSRINLVIFSSLKQLEKSKDEIETILKLIESLFYAEKTHDNWCGILEIWKILLDYIENIENRTVFLIVSDFIKNEEWERHTGNIEDFLKQYNIKIYTPREGIESKEECVYKNICHGKDLDSIIGMYYRLYIETVPKEKKAFEHYFKEEVVFGSLNRYVREQYINITERLKTEKRYITLITEAKSLYENKFIALSVTLGMALCNFGVWFLVETYFEGMKTCTNICD